MDWGTAFAALLGAVVGGAASTVGALWASRRQLTRDCRISLYTSILPPLIERIDSAAANAAEEQPGHLGNLQPAFEELVRKSTVAGSREARLALGALDIAKTLNVTDPFLFGPDGPRNAAENSELSNRQLMLASELCSHLERYSDWLATKIR